MTHLPSLFPHFLLENEKPKDIQWKNPPEFKTSSLCIFYSSRRFTILVEYLGNGGCHRGNYIFSSCRANFQIFPYSSSLSLPLGPTADKLSRYLRYAIASGILETFRVMLIAPHFDGHLVTPVHFTAATTTAAT